jgi:hypothetical protein
VTLETRSANSSTRDDMGSGQPRQCQRHVAAAEVGSGLLIKYPRGTPTVLFPFEQANMNRTAFDYPGVAGRAALLVDRSDGDPYREWLSESDRHGR